MEITNGLSASVSGQAPVKDIMFYDYFTTTDWLVHGSLILLICVTVWAITMQFIAASKSTRELKELEKARQDFHDIVATSKLAHK